MRRRIVEVSPRVRHECHAHGCTREVPPRLLMCGKHWAMVPRPVQMMVWKEYRAGQENTKDPSTAYLAAHHTAIAVVAMAEGYTKAAAEHRVIAAGYTTEA
jgi:diadenosine tetraphosphatase ApaH/serine/threonine PP2A family protein phosphatase